jgi:hypothetical protein
MWKLLQYYGKYQNARGVLSDMPGWARLLILLAALPGLLLILLSLLAFCISILALLLLSVPVYRLLRLVTGAKPPASPVLQAPLGGVDFVEPAEPPAPSTVVEPPPQPTVTEATIQLTPAPPTPNRRNIEVKIIE